MKRVCKNCKWYQIGFWHEECWRHHNCYERGGEIYQEFVGKLELDLKQNDNWNCIYYEPKNWWVKLKNRANNPKREQ